ncbi:hypothetical protein SynBIOSE41_01389 [Synechococcus sp. BIOS-E4-1]|nr:hypothetical protein SynBIOSE41_01389 [Synechococcus sp. BIOS-E4-1]
MTFEVLTELGDCHQPAGSDVKSRCEVDDPPKHGGNRSELLSRGVAINTRP